MTDRPRVAFRYDASKGRFRNVPNRDLTQAQFAALDPGQQRTVLTSGAWSQTEAPQRIEDMRRADLDALATERGIDPGQHDTKASLIAALTTNETEG